MAMVAVAVTFSVVISLIADLGPTAGRSSESQPTGFPGHATVNESTTAVSFTAFRTVDTGLWPILGLPSVLRLQDGAQRRGYSGYIFFGRS